MFDETGGLMDSSSAEEGRYDKKYPTKQEESRLVKKTIVMAVLMALAVAALATPAYAASVHLKGGANAEPAFTDNGLTLSASGELSGLGNADVLITIVAVANPTATCSNPSVNDGKDQQPAGQNPAPVTVTGSISIPASEVKNGNTPFSVVTDAPVTPIEGAPDCPGSNWTENIVDMAFTSATITVEQPPGTVVLTVTCTISPPTSDGAVPKADVVCTSS